MDVVKANQALFGQLSNQRQWYSLVVVSFNNLQEVHAQNLEDHDKMLSIRAVVDE